MIDWAKSSLNLKANSTSFDEFKGCILDLARHESIGLMENLRHHGETSCLQHSLHVSYISYRLCRRLGFDYRSAARGALLHDFFLYDWHITKPDKGLHGFTHPHTALENADTFFRLSDKEKDIIIKHMWPLTVKPPKYKEAFIVAFADKYCALIEIVKGIRIIL
jgi:uncharacterized protein